jgi:gas vesicle protein
MPRARRAGQHAAWVLGHDETAAESRSATNVAHMNIPVFRRRRATQIGTAARAMAQRTPETLTVVRRRAQPTAVTVARLAGTAVFAYLVALPFPVTPRPVLAPLTALLVAQVSLYQTLRSAVRRVAAVLIGVLLAVGLSAVVGFTWWSLGVVIVVGLAVGYALRLGETILEVPISAMLILSVTGASAAAYGRVIETLIGAAAGLAAGLILAPLRVQPASEAIQDLCRKMADLLDQMAAGLRDGSFADHVDDWLRQARSLGGEIDRVDDALRQAEDSVRLNPRGVRVINAPVSLRGRLETLEHAAITVRVLARSLADSARLEGGNSPMEDPDARERLAGTLADLAVAIRISGGLAAVTVPSSQDHLESEVDRYLAAAKDQQDQLSELLGTDPAARPVGWPLRGEMISHLDRLRDEVREASQVAPPQPRRIRSWRRPLPAGRRQRRSPTRRRDHRR